LQVFVGQTVIVVVTGQGVTNRPHTYG